ncbi:CRISPR system precrRNA processing endoribonuclease RAMP protein Cas6 [Caldithrix abyssi]|uniref:CRISPR system precrRNA processing endoribonuclease RAMP protein Cas6 n=1 Tax=Caldithrix abyssi TaxID=187145 RepID=UPI0014716B62|nr:CRISPR system precrRNA processing endoribonuclease RAMP protein Cas6 [Caldithrix abyssi]
MFETFNSRNESVARPFVLEPPLTEKKLFPPGDTLKFNLILFGKAIEYFPLLVYTFKEMGKRGIGVKRGKFWLKQVTVSDQVVYDYQEQMIKTNFRRQNIFSIEKEQSKFLRIRFLTPTALKVKGKITNTIDFITLLKSIRRRIKALNVYHNGQLREVFDIDFEKAEEVKVKKSAIEEFRWERYSNRQQKKIDYSGFWGEMELEGDLTPFMAILRMGEIVHIGRGTVYGMGKYVIESVVS